MCSSRAHLRTSCVMSALTDLAMICIPQANKKIFRKTTCLGIHNSKIKQTYPLSELKNNTKETCCQK